MYTNIKTILTDAAEKNYAVIATSAVNMESARAIITAASEKCAPVIILLGQNMMHNHAKAELIVPLIKTLASYTKIPVAVCLDHGSSTERIMYAIKNGFSSIMYDGSLYDFETNMRKTKHYAEICHALNMGIEGELGHVGQASSGDNLKEDLYTRPEDAREFVKFTGTDCLAVACGTAHGEYPAGFVPQINFDIIKSCKDATNGMPIALHGGSGSGDENILKAVKAGINKINVVTDVFNASRDALKAELDKNPKIGYMDLMARQEEAIQNFIKHWIDLSGSEGRAENFTNPENIFMLGKTQAVGISE